MAVAWVAAPYDEVLGHVCLVHSDGLARVLALERLFVSPAMARLGVGVALVTQASEWAKSQEHRLTLDVAENCADAIGLYKRLGWHLTGRTRIPGGEDAARRLLHFDAP